MGSKKAVSIAYFFATAYLIQLSIKRSDFFFIKKIIHFLISIRQKLEVYQMVSMTNGTNSFSLQYEFSPALVSTIMLGGVMGFNVAIYNLLRFI